jgi:hypothetical protein
MVFLSCRFFRSEQENDALKTLKFINVKSVNVSHEIEYIVYEQKTCMHQCVVAVKSLLIWF